MLKSAGKIVAFLLITGSCVFILKMNTRTKHSESHSTTLSVAADTSLFFIGSSRVQKSIDPKIINGHFNNLHVVNFGIQGGNFLSNCVMADFVIQQGGGHKVLFIELAFLMEELPNGVFNFSSETGSSPSRSVFALTRGQSFSEQSMLLSNILNHQLFNSITVGDEVREIIGYKVNNGNRQLIGFHPYEKNDWHDVTPFLTWREINTSETKVPDLSRYTAMIDYLEKLAKSSDSQIVFFLPVTYASQVERDIATGLYRGLPATMKLEYTKDFLNEIAREEYLGDQNHLNKKGAEAYSSLLIAPIESFIQKHHIPK